MSAASGQHDENPGTNPAPRLTGPWNLDAVVRHLESATIPIRLATTTARGPSVQSLWFEFSHGAIWCATQADALVTRRLRRNPRCGFEVAGDQPPYHGVRGQGVAEILPAQGVEKLERLLQRYGFHDSELAHWLLSRADAEVAIRIRPETITSWDFRERM